MDSRLDVPCVRHYAVRECAFAVAAPRAWSGLPGSQNQTEPHYKKLSDTIVCNGGSDYGQSHHNSFQFGSTTRYYK